MERLENTFKTLKTKNQKALLIYLTAGDPDLATTEKLIPRLDEAGADILEIGIPFSDPLADGPVIQKASKRSLDHHSSVAKIIKMTGRLKGRVSAPLVFMTYFNPVHRYGIKKFFTDSKRAGVSGVIVPDLPLEESDELCAEARRVNMAVIFLIAPTSGLERMKKISAKTSGFIYFVSMTGVTGMKGPEGTKIEKHLREIRALTSKPLCVGFGIESPAQAREISAFCDGVIVGSAFVKKLEEGHRKKSYGPAIQFVRKLAGALHEK